MTEVGRPTADPVRREALLWGAMLGGAAGLAALDWRILAVGVLGLAVAAGAWWCVGGPLRWWTAFVLLVLLAPPLPFDIGSAGPHVGLAFAAAGLWIGAWRLRDWRLELDGPALTLGAFFAWMLASVGFATFYSGVSVMAAGALRVGLFGIGVFAYFYTAHGPGRLVRVDSYRWARLLLAAGSASAAFAVADFYFQWTPPGGFAEQFIWLPFGVYRRAQGVFYEAGMLGNLCATLLLMAAVVMARRSLRHRVATTPALLAGSTILLAALAASFSRSSVLNLAVGLAAILALEGGPSRFRRPAAFGAAAILGAGLVAWIAAPNLLIAYGRRLGDTVLYSGASPNALLSGRLETWSALLARLAEHPWVLLTGIGFKTLPSSDYLGSPLIVDSMYLSVLAEMGILGLLLASALTAAILSTGLRARKQGGESGWFCGTCLICSWAGNLAQMLSVDVLTYWRVLPLTFFLWALARRSADSGEGR